MVIKIDELMKLVEETFREEVFATTSYTSITVEGKEEFLSSLKKKMEEIDKQNEDKLYREFTNSGINML